MNKLFLLPFFIGSIVFAQVTDTGDKVGIGTSNPEAKLDINGNIMFNTGSERLYFGSAHTGTNNFRSFLSPRTSDNTAWDWGQEFGYHNFNRAWYFDGNVGIGTTAPNYLLDMRSGGGISRQLHLGDEDGVMSMGGNNLGQFLINGGRNKYGNYSTTHGAGIHGLNGDILFQTISGVTIGTAFNPSVRMKIAANGNIGIGTTSPLAKLHIVSSSTIGWNDIANSNVLIGNSTIGVGIDNNEIATKGGHFYVGTIDSGDDIIFRAGGVNPRMSINGTNGDIGIGTTTPSSLLTLNSTSGSVITLQHNNLTKSSIIGELDGASGGNLEFWTREDGGSNTQKMVIKPSGNVGIGTATPDAKLAVNGNIHTKEVKVDLIGWSDFVFKSDYKLPTLKEVEQHIKDNGHLKNIPSAEEVAKNGFFLGEMDSKLLQKIEELTLYTIDQENRIETLEAKNEKLVSLVEKLLKTKIEE